IVKDLPEILKGPVKLPKRGPAKVSQRHRFEAEPQVPDHREDDQGQDERECGGQHPKGKPGLFV
ncbi:MAG: hypothetical protein JSV01_10540, partial [Desulfobacterales bacterium]